MNQGIIVLTGTETRQLLSCVFSTLKNKELFNPTYNGITASVSFVSITLVVLNAIGSPISCGKRK